VARRRVDDSALPSLPRVLVARVPRLPRYYEELRRPNAHPAALRFPSLGGTDRCASLRFLAARRRRPDPELSGVAAPRHLSVGDVWPSQVPGESFCAFALLFDPGRTDVPKPLRDTGAAPANVTAKAPATRPISGLNHMASALAVYASPRRLPGQDARLASGCWLGFAAWDW